MITIFKKKKNNNNIKTTTTKNKNKKGAQSEVCKIKKCTLAHYCQNENLNPVSNKRCFEHSQI